MEKKDLKDLSRKELIDLVSNIVDEDSKSDEDLPSLSELSAEKERLEERSRFKKTLLSTFGILIVVAAVAVLLSTLLFPVIQVSGDSMAPTLNDGDILLLLKSRNYSSGELCCISWQNKLLIKRIIALPGDNIEIDENGNVYVNGNLLDEPYLMQKSLGNCDIEFPYQVPDGKFFVMGDKRDSSIDSRNSAVGCIDDDQMIGRVLFKVWKG